LAAGAVGSGAGRTGACTWTPCADAGAGVKARRNPARAAQTNACVGRNENWVSTVLGLTPLWSEKVRRSWPVEDRRSPLRSGMRSPPSWTLFYSAFDRQPMSRLAALTAIMPDGI
jgi:hypothetical protein